MASITEACSSDVNNAIQSNGQEEPSKSLFTMLAKPNHPINYKCKV